MFDSLDYNLIIEYINNELLIRINNLDGGFNFTSEIIRIGLFYDNSDEILNTYVKYITTTVCMLTGIQNESYSKYIKPILEYVNIFIKRVYNNNSNSLKYVTSLLIIIDYILYYSDTLLLFFDYENDENMIEIKEKIISIRDLLQILLYVIIAINLYDPQLIGSWEKYIMIQFNKFKRFVKTSTKKLKELILNIFFPKTKTKTIMFTNFDLKKNDNSIEVIPKESNKLNYYYVSKYQDGGNNSESIYNEAKIIVEKYFKGENLSKLLKSLHYKFFPESNNLTNKRKFTFNTTSGLIESSKLINKTVWLTPNKTIKIVCKGFDIKYFKSDNTQIDSISYFDGNPIHLAIVLCWLESKSTDHSNKQNIIINDFNATKYLESDPNLNKDILDKTCKQIYGSNYSKDECGEYYHSILGKSSISILRILAKSNLDFAKLVNPANKNIHYEILKILNFKKNSNGLICSFDQWFENLNISVKQDYSKYLNNQVKNLINQIVISLNSNQSLLI